MRKRFIVPAVFALATALCLGACSSSWDGKAYGQLTWTTGYNMWVNSDFSSTSGFPVNASSNSYKGTSYAMSAGSYYFVYYLVDPISSATYSPYYVHYSIVEEGGSRGNPGADHYYLISCDTIGATIQDTTSSNASRSAAKAVAQADGEPVVIQGDGYKITMTVTKTTLSDTEKASFISLGK
jgi:hypothetical protein